MCKPPYVQTYNVIKKTQIVHVKEQLFAYIDTCHHYLDIYPQEKMRDVSRPSYNSDPNFRPKTPPEFVSGPKPNKSKMSPVYPLAYRKLLEVNPIII